MWGRGKETSLGKESISASIIKERSMGLIVGSGQGQNLQDLKWGPSFDHEAMISTPKSGGGWPIIMISISNCCI